jgi:uncharacterized membrane protein YhhN
LVGYASRGQDLRRFLGLYLIIVLADLAVGLIPILQGFRILSKPLIVLSLIYFYNRQTAGTTPPISLVYAALFCSLLGDTILIYSSTLPHAFILGLVSFLAAHILYAIAFYRQINIAKINIKLFSFSAILLATYAFSFFHFMHPHFGKMLIPVVAYMWVILIMALLALSRKNSVAQPSFYWCGLGALLFIASDSILAIDRFRLQLAWADIAIMTTYSLAQIFIIWGFIISLEPKKTL